MIGNSKDNLSRSGVDWGSIAIFFVLMLLGWLNIYAAVYDETTTEGFTLASRYGSQLIWIGVCVLTAIVIMLIDGIYYHMIAYPF